MALQKHRVKNAFVPARFRKNCVNVSRSHAKPYPVTPSVTVLVCITELSGQPCASHCSTQIASPAALFRRSETSGCSAGQQPSSVVRRSLYLTQPHTLAGPAPTSGRSPNATCPCPPFPPGAGCAVMPRDLMKMGFCCSKPEPETKCFLFSLNEKRRCVLPSFGHYRL